MKPTEAIAAYLAEVQKKLATGHAREHAYRPALENLYKSLTDLEVINEPKGSEHGRPDFIFAKKKSNFPIAWSEAKDLHVDLEKVEKSEQMARYYGYPNLILTNGIEFRFYKNGTKYGDAIAIAEKHGGSIEPKESSFEILARTLADFIAAPIDTIRSAEHLAKIMGGKGRRLRENIIEQMSPDYQGTKGEAIEKIMHVLKDKLIHDLSIEEFADLYTQTLVYGLFVARYHDKTADTFTREEARGRIPANNHLLQQFFDHIAGANFEPRLKIIVDELCDVFLHADVKSLVHGLYEQINLKGEIHDPIIHFYEDFLKEYDPKLRMDRGVFYTPLPVVRYIVRSVDAILKEHFDLAQGLADRAQIEMTYESQGKKAKRTIDRVQILDPAVGTGTFLHEVIRKIHEAFKGQEGQWPKYVEEHLVPRLHGFELMMASYTIAHLKLGMTLAETGVKTLKNRLRIFLTNSLEEAPLYEGTLFSIGLQEAITEEAMAAAEVKRDYPIMVVMGNPPYSGHSANKGEWIEKLLEDYKQEPGGGKLQEKNPKWLNDDYVKFIRFAEHLIEKNKQGILAFITNHSYLDNPTFRGMRWHLLQTFDDIYIVDLHGNSKKKEIAPDGSSDENVFDIQQGVGIFIGVKTGKPKGLAKVNVLDVFGKRQEKYEWLEANDVLSSKFQTITLQKPDFNFVHRNNETFSEYKIGISIKDLMRLNVMGFQTHRDHFAITFDKQDMHARIGDMRNDSISDEELRSKYEIKDNRDWQLKKQRLSLRNCLEWESNIIQCAYRPFDDQWCYFSYVTMDYPRKELIEHVENRKNLMLIVGRQGQVVGSTLWNVLWTSDKVVDANIFYRGGGTVFPLYLYSSSETIDNNKRKPNLNMELLKPVLSKLKFKWAEDGMGNGKDVCGPEDIFDYIYAVLHSPTYRERYKEFLKIDFPRVPFTSNRELFWRLVKLGREIRLLHLMESPVLDKLITKYPIDGSNVVEKLKYEKEKVWINSKQYFDGVPKEAWEFWIGGYQPAQKWLKDRKGRVLSSDDVEHYQKMIVALKETGKVMGEIDEEIKKSGGWPIQ